MKKVFKKSYMLENGGCYSENKMGKLTEPRPNLDDDIFIHEILDSPVPLYDKYYFVFKHCEIETDDVLRQTLYFLTTAYDHFKSHHFIEWNTSQGTVETPIEEKSGDILKVIDNIFYLFVKNAEYSLSYKDLEDHKSTIEAIGVESSGDIKFLTMSIYAFIDMVDAIEQKEPFQNVLDEAFVVLKNITRFLVSRPDLKEKLLDNLKKFTA